MIVERNEERNGKGKDERRGWQGEKKRKWSKTVETGTKQYEQKQLARQEQ